MMNLKPILPAANAIILRSDEFFLLHEIIMAYPDGLPDVSPFDPRVVPLRDYGFVQQKAYRWFPTEAGVNHVMPRRGAVH
jgi:hypothetical protein